MVYYFDGGVEATKRKQLFICMLMAKQFSAHIGEIGPIYELYSYNTKYILQFFPRVLQQHLAHLQCNYLVYYSVFTHHLFCGIVYDWKLQI
jgi:hypothetical protein